MEDRSMRIDKETEVAISSLTEDQRFVYQEFSKMVGKILTIIETIIPEEDSRLLPTKKSMNRIMYDTRNKFLFEFAPVSEGQRKKVKD